MKNISFVTNCSKNTRQHLELLLRSLRDNLDGQDHEVLVFIDSDNEGIHEYLWDMQVQFKDLRIVKNNMSPCTGYALNNNLLVKLAKYDIVSYLQSDMVVGPHYDTHILSQLEDNMILSSTRVEPPLHGYSDYTITKDFGTDPKKFSMKEWNTFSKSAISNRAAEYFFAPITFYKSVWEKLGGYDTRFRRSREDSDLVQRALHAGVRLVQTWEANVYHFTCVSSRGKDWFDKGNDEAQSRVTKQFHADQVELKRFIRKWGSFNHGEYPLKKYDVDVVIRINSQPHYCDFISIIEPYVSRVWLEDDKCIENLKLDTHSHANELFGFSENQWKFASKFYNTEETYLKSKIRVLKDNDIEYNVLLEIDLQNNTQINGEYIYKLHQIIEATEVGKWEMQDNMTLTIKNKVELQNDICVINPEFDMSLLTIE